MSSAAIIYRIDADDRLTFVNQAWDDFARLNSGEAVVSADVIGRSLWSFISDATTREVYRQVLARIRAGRTSTYSFRCDSPACRRLLEMRIALVDDSGAVEFRTEPLYESERVRAAVPQGDGWGGGDRAELVRVCGWCNRFEADGEWMEVEDALPRLRLLEYPERQMLTHGVCDRCFERISAELTKLEAEAHPAG